MSLHSFLQVFFKEKKKEKKWVSGTTRNWGEGNYLPSPVSYLQSCVRSTCMISDEGRF